jgi:hypothetical protein
MMKMQDVGRNSAGGGGNGNDSSRQEIAARAGVPTDTIVGSGPKGSGVVTSAGGPVTSARGVTQAAGDLGISEDEVRARINAAVTAAPGLVLAVVRQLVRLTKRLRSRKLMMPRSTFLTRTQFQDLQSYKYQFDGSAGRFAAGHQHASGGV